jgi:hypothetical protein
MTAQSPVTLPHPTPPDRELLVVNWANGWIQRRRLRQDEQVVFDAERRMGVHEELVQEAQKATFVGRLQQGTKPALVAMTQSSRTL